MTTRRDFIMTTAGALAFAGLRPAFAIRQPAAAAPSSLYQAVPVRGGGVVLEGNGGNTLLMPTEAGPVLVDTKFVFSAVDFKDEILARGAAPTMVINTHHHGDHTGGNWAFSDDALMVGHENIIPRMDQNVDNFYRMARSYVRRLAREGDQAKLDRATDALEKINHTDASNYNPKKTLKDELTLTHGGLEIRMIHSGPGHTDNDILVFFPQHNVLHTGDLVFNGLYPYIDVAAKANTESWQTCLRTALTLCNDETVVVPGHGVTGDKALIEAQITLFETIRAAVKDAVAAGKTADEIKAMPFPRFAAYGNERRDTTIAVILDELVGWKNTP